MEGALMDLLEHRIKSLETLLSVEYVECDDENCCTGINSKSKNLCDICEGVGFIHKQTPVQSGVVR